MKCEVAFFCFETEQVIDVRQTFNNLSRWPKARVGSQYGDSTLKARLFLAGLFRSDRPLHPGLSRSYKPVKGLPIAI